ncbi:uncharacterized protein LOC128894615 [Hylaeus anthracinus]|uniref:uncharacterized protein LOC128894615 n=1 Tax=Hylaeus anthracinus TaxID=313031 RepID=UPI0023B8B29C|nr:uncharacterized protein LOC128894615 [Hylaeus anthracinus]
MTSSMIVILLTLVSCCAAFPVRPEGNLGPIVGVLIQQPAGLDGGPRESSPIAYAVLLDDSEMPEAAPGAALVEKRDVQEEEPEDLETAAGTYALRPLFVYRQQLAYRERVREANRRGNRF